MRLRVKRATWLGTFGLLGLVSLPMGVQAGDINIDSLHINTNSELVTLGQGGSDVDFVAFGRDSVGAQASVTSPRISAIDLFSNQAIFSFGNSSFAENKPITSIHANSDIAQFWQTTILSGTKTTIGKVNAEQYLSLVQTFTTPVSAIVPKKDSTDLDDLGMPMMSQGLALNVDANSRSAEAPAESANPSVSSLENPVLEPHMIRNSAEQPLATTPEPTSIAVLGLFGAGLLIRRRVR